MPATRIRRPAPSAARDPHPLVVDEVEAAAGHLSIIEADVLDVALREYAEHACVRALVPGAGAEMLGHLADAARRLRSRLAAGARQRATWLSTSANRPTAPHPLQELHPALTVREDMVLWGALLDFEADAGARADAGDLTANTAAEIAADLIEHLSIASHGPGGVLDLDPAPRHGETDHA